MGYKNARVSDVTHSKIKELALLKGIPMNQVMDIAVNKLYREHVYIDQRGNPINMGNEELACYESGGEIIPNSSESYSEYLNRVLIEEGVIRLYD